MTKQRMMMQGSEGKMDYIIAAKCGSAAIGVNPVIEAAIGEDGSPRILIGARIRLAAAPGETILSASHVAKTLCPAIPWQKKDNERCSVFLGSLVPPFPDDFTPDSLIVTLTESEFFDKIMECAAPIYDVKDGLIIADADEVLGFIVERFKEVSSSFLKLKKSYPVDGSKVIPFKPTLQ